jgi:hypothetical protein
MHMKISKETIFQIKNSGGSTKALATEFRLSQKTIRRIRRGKIARQFLTV